MRYETTMTVKGQITVPKDVRDALGLKPGQKVGIELDQAGEARIVRADPLPELTREEWLARVKEAGKHYKPHPDVAGKDGLDYQRWIRPDRIDV